ncbi:MAG TPA: hypothetical protein V6C58_28960, partial [Allocoleopsis sp.]
LFFRFVIGVFGLMPFPLLYLLSDFVCLILYKIVGYRKKVVFNNLKNSFPDKSPTEIKRIADLFYKHLADLLVESFKGFSMSEKTFNKRYIFKNPEVINKNPEAGGNSIIMAPHYGNWEWGVLSLPMYIKIHIVGFYKPLKNKYIDDFTRTRYKYTNIELLSIAQTNNGFEKNKDKSTAYFLVSDQSIPSDKGHWVTFLNQDTICPYGGDKYAHTYNYPVFYLEINRVRRGFYELIFEKLASNPANLPEQEITKLFMARLEKQIKAKPQEWLWSHKRWKHKRTQ